jgi:hypothetical protein
MTPKEKAKQLYELIRYDVSTLKGTEALINEVAKRCALIAVDEIIQAMDNVMFPNPFKQYWNKVKQEIQAL